MESQPASIICHTRTGMRQMLREATHAVHERLHRHAGFAAILDRNIDRSDYRALLSRLYGFHAVFERNALLAPRRSGNIVADLTALGLTRHSIMQIELCPFVPDLETPERRAGALYVIEGSSLGGLQLSKCLDDLLGRGTLDGRRFFAHRMAADGGAWRGVLAALERWEHDLPGRRKVVQGAVDTFAAFETWIAGWKSKVDA